MSFLCKIGIHDWKWIWDTDSKIVKEMLYPMYDGSINRACLRCEKLDMRATRYLNIEDTRKEKLKKILDKEIQKD